MPVLTLTPPEVEHLLDLITRNTQTCTYAFCNCCDRSEAFTSSEAATQRVRFKRALRVKLMEVLPS